VELAVLLPFFCFIFVAAVDYARIFYFYILITNCARDGALYASVDAGHSLDAVGIQRAAVADAGNLSPAPNVSSATGTDGAGNAFVRVTVTYTFNTISGFPGIPSSTALARTVQMRVLP
jgi:Flp pilus assembly protein TadG